MAKIHSRFLAICAVALSLASPSRAAAQLPIPTLAVVGGISQFDLSGTGTGQIGALRLDVPLLFVLAEGSLGVLRAPEDVGTRTYLIPEAQVQWQILPTLVRPYIGIGGGLIRAISGPGGHPSTVTVSGAAGVRVGIPLIGAGLRAEVRVRGIGTGFGGSSAEYTVGVTL